jgi:3-deoxy-D-manno-octulosonic-acid transferase
MFMLYNLVVHVLVLCLLPLALLISLLKPNISREIMERLGLYSKEFADYLHALKQAKKDIIWLNAASVGEIIMVQPLIKELGERYPNSGYIVVTNSCSGQQMANKLFGAEKVILQPLDLPGIARRVARKVKPKLTIVVEFEMWPNIIQALSKVGSKVVLINGAMDNKILKYYRLFPGLLKATLNKLDFLGMKNETEKKIVDSLGVKPSKIRVTGDLKYDGSFKVMCKDDKKAIKDSLDIPENAIVLVAGSTHPGEEEIIFKVYIELKEEFKDLVLIIAPRQIERVAEIRQLGEGYSLKPVERTRLAAKDFKGTLGYEVVILDTIGELVDLYSISTIAFVGGSFAKIGGHNLLEPVFYGKPVLFGPNIFKVQKTAEWLIDQNVGILVENEDELKEELFSLLQDQKRRQTIGQKATALIQAREGATNNNLKVIREFLAGF